MTLPYERYNSIKRTETFLRDLTDSKKTARIPKHIRLQAWACLRHYPTTKAPNVFETDSPIDELSLLLHDYEDYKK